MAHHYAKPLSLLFLIGLFLFVSLKVEARESKHFSKVIHSHHRQPQLAPELAPSPSPAPAPAPEEIIQPPMSTGSGYGLFDHHESTKFPSSTTTTTTSAATISRDDENEFRGGELSQNYREETSHPYKNNNNNYNTNGYYTTKYNYNGNYGAGEKQGMSDTRYLENGKFYYNAGSENNNNNNYYSNSNGYQKPAVVRGSSHNIGGYFGKTQYEFDSMEEYERQQGYYPETQGEFVP